MPQNVCFTDKKDNKTYVEQDVTYTTNNKLGGSSGRTYGKKNYTILYNDKDSGFYMTSAIN